MKNIIRKITSLICLIFFLFTLNSNSVSALATPTNKCTSNLVNELSKISLNESINVAIVGKVAFQTENENRTINKNLSLEEVQQIIQETRINLKTEQFKANKELLNTANITNVSYISEYAPLIFAKMSKKDIVKLSQNNNIEKIHFCNDTIKTKEYFNNSRNVIRANTIQNSNLFGYSGDGVKIGILEAKHPNTSFASITNADITFHPASNAYMEPSQGGHATTITSILASQGTTNTAVGLAPDAEYHCASVEAYAENSNSFYEAYSKTLGALIDANVNIINISTGFSFPIFINGNWIPTLIYNSYTTTSEADAYFITWLIDYYSDNAHVSFSIAAGNEGKKGIPFPFLSYNAIVVGNIDDNNTYSISDDTLHFASSHYNEITPTYASKPDLSAPGTNIYINGSNELYTYDPQTNSWVYKEITGSSFSAPHVVGAIALLGEQTPALLLSPAVIKAILTAGVYTSKHSYTPQDRILTTIDSSPASSYIQYGAGIVNCINNSLIASNETYDYGYILSNTTQSTSTLQLTGQKNVRISFTYELNTMNGTNRNLTLDNFDIHLYDSNGNLLDSSTTTFNNVEIIDTYISTTGNYTLRITRPTSTNLEIDMGLAWIQY